MGLDITAYGNLTEDESGEAELYANPDFPGQFEGLRETSYSYERTMGFHAGGYTGYNRWRESLTSLTGYNSPSEVWAHDDPQGPFVELIHFSDCEGAIGPVVSAKLAKDFADHDGDAANVGEWFYKLYQEWRRAFEMAAGNGAVEFH